MQEFGSMRNKSVTTLRFDTYMTGETIMETNDEGRGQSMTQPPEQPAQRQKSRRRGQGEGSVYQRKDGRFVGSFRLENGKRKYVYAETRREAREKLRVAFNAYKQGTLVAGSNQTLKQFLEQWLQAKRMELKDGTYVPLLQRVCRDAHCARTGTSQTAEGERRSSPVILR